MKKLIFSMVMAGAACAFAADAVKTNAGAQTNAATETKAATEAPKEELEKDDSFLSLFWGCLGYGFYSGYQLYGSIVNTEPVLQGFADINMNLPWSVGPMDDLGYIGGGLWSNSDLTGKRDHMYRRAFNEWDPNVHWGKTFWFDDDKTVGLGYRTSVIWYCYPVTGNRTAENPFTMDWDHYFELVNPYLIPYINVVHEYRRTDGNLLQFGVKKPWQITDDFSITPFVEMVWRDHRYGWCFSNFGMDENYRMQSAGLATLKLELDATYMFTSWLGVFAKVAYCQNLDEHMRESADVAGESTYGDAYGQWNEFCWGGVGLIIVF